MAAPAALPGPGRWSFVLAALLCSALATALWVARDRVDLLHRLDGLSLDAQTQWRGPLKPASREPILLVELDEASVQALGRVVPGRAELAQALERLQAAGARLAVLDLLLLDSSRDEPAGDVQLAAIMKAWPRVLIPFALPQEAQADAPSGEAGTGSALLAQAFRQYRGDSTPPWLQAGHLLAPLPTLAEAAAGLGHVTARRDGDGALRHDLPALLLAGEVYPSLALRAAAAARGLDWAQTRLDFGRGIDLAGGLRLPLDGLSRQWVNYYGPRGSFEHIGFLDLLEGRVAPERLAGRIVLMGATALGSGDHFPSPFDGALPGVERLATVLDNILSERSLQRPQWAGAAELGLMLGLPALAAWGLSRWRLWQALLASLLLVGGLLALAQWGFEQQRVWLALAFPGLAFLLGVLAALGLRGLREQARREQAWAALQASEARYALASQGANDGLWDWDLQQNTVYYSERWLALMGLSAAEAGSGMAAWTLALDASGRQAFETELQAHLQGLSLQFSHELHLRQGGQDRWLLARGLVQREGGLRDGLPLRMAGSLTDISEQRRLQAQLSHDALHDRLTGLANRSLFSAQLAQVLKGSDAAQLSVLVLGLDEFRAYNESQGSLAGDALLQELARRLQAQPGLLGLARLGGDVFGLAGMAAAGLQSAVQTALAGLPLSASLGHAVAGQGLSSSEELLVAAETALAQAKDLGTGRSHAFDPAEQLLAHSRRLMREHIDRALREGEFQLYYQPFVDLASRQLLGFEALIRWPHPQRGMVMPGDFIPVAEASGQIAAIGRWTLLEAAAQLRRWHGFGFQGEIAVNVSGLQLERGEELLADARATLLALGEVPARQLKLEVTESMAMAQPQRCAELLQTLAAMGFKISIDDFGTGYSSLAYLHRFPFDTLKIDRSFVIRLGAGREAQEIVRTIVGLALALDKQVLAEGVEEEAQARLLQELGVQVAQGWLFAKALPAAEAERLIGGPGWPRPALSSV
ncbi:EAL domain-containing protein [Paucibacter sp. DJ2R-2]|uniref:EAL domain-containing protein n=1 Tax=Paucibacter sp. DJ2R-2 TaxID=2893558 RepID=UPI0021E44D02|nr:EAL domain-containing protein [Paucibacter sp. DJ2R-2]MCV2421631.1 EAL domain-containing protein [Paucibacter sp. DJ4R-1]MCV2438336.1 EAL domain-containing protein [Paucibacter sp. DJ2R-2]